MSTSKGLKRAFSLHVLVELTKTSVTEKFLRNFLDNVDFSFKCYSSSASEMYCTQILVGFNKNTKNNVESSYFEVAVLPEQLK